MMKSNFLTLILTSAKNQCYSEEVRVGGKMLKNKKNKEQKVSKWKFW